MSANMKMMMKVKECVSVLSAKYGFAEEEAMEYLGKRVIRTEDTGKQFEMGICLAYGIPYQGKYNYGKELPEKLEPRLKKLLELFPMCSHTANKGARYDFTSTDNKEHLSAKSTKKGIGKVAPQVIGQCNPIKFCEIIGIDYRPNTDLKKYIQTNIISILPILESYTFDCPNIYYNQEKNTIRYITLNKPIEWDKYKYKWTCNYNEWNNSSSLKIVGEEKEMALLEVQFHTKSRNNMAIRWYYENVLYQFKDKMCILEI